MDRETSFANNRYFFSAIALSKLARALSFSFCEFEMDATGVTD